MAQILSVGLPEFKSQYDLANLDSTTKFDDYEIVIFDALHYLRNSLPKDSQFLSADATEKINANLARRSADIWRFVEDGGLAIYFPHSKLDYKGYLSNSVKTLSFGDLIFEKNLTPSVGQKLQITNKINEHIRNFLNKLNGLLIHRVILPNYAEYEACLESKDQAQIVGSYKLHESGGAIIIMPTLSFSNDENLEKFVRAVKELRADMPAPKQKKPVSLQKLEAEVVELQKAELAQKAEAIHKTEITAKALPNTKNDAGKTTMTAAEIVFKPDPVNNTSDTSQLPSWHTEYVLPAQKPIAESIVSIEEEIENLVSMLNTKKAEFKELNVFKLLVTAQGKPLERMVANVLASLGFKVQEGPLGRGDFVAQYRDSVLLIIVKGREGKGAIESDAASLEKWAAKYFEENNKLAKPILIVNGYLDLAVADRSEDVFPQSMLRYSVQREHSLITGLQLLCLHSEAVKHPEKQSAYVDKLIKNVGVYPDYKDEEWQRVISLASTHELKVPA